MNKKIIVAVVTVALVGAVAFGVVAAQAQTLNPNGFRAMTTS